MKKVKINSKAKNILLVISIIFNVLYTLILVLSLCSVKKNKTQIVSAENDRITCLFGSTWEINEVIEYSPQGAYMYNAPFDIEENYYISYSTNAGEVYDNFVFSYLDNQGVISSYLEYENHEVPFNIYNFRNNTWLGNGFRTIYIYAGVSAYDNYLINWLYDNAKLVSYEPFGSTDFIFSKNFNYNAPFGLSGDSVFIPNLSVSNNQINFDFEFVSNGEVFNRIRLQYIAGANGTQYFTTPGGTLTNVGTNTDFGYYTYMVYINTRTNVERLVNTRSLRSTTSNGVDSMALDFGSTWKNPNYQVLHFDYKLSSSESTFLGQFNNYDVYNGSFSDVTGDVGLGNVFTLLGSAFGSLSTIFAIQLLPGITIGLLFFMPLIVGIIIFIIWLVKR